MMFAVQTRDHEGDIRLWPSLTEALEYASIRRSVWKISFTLYETAERIRLVRSDAPCGAAWVYEPLLETALALLEAERLS